MSKLSTQYSGQKKPQGIPNRPPFCTCGERVAVALVMVRNDYGDVKMGPYSQYGFIHSGELILKTGYTFHDWGAWCAECYSKKFPSWREVEITNRIGDAA